MELAEREEHKREEDELIDGPLSPSSRKVVNACYDNIDRSIMDSCTYLLEVWIHQIEVELDYIFCIEREVYKGKLLSFQTSNNPFSILQDK